MPLNATATLRSLCCCYRLFYSLLGPPRRVFVCVCARASVFALVVALICGAAHTKHGSFLNMCRSRRHTAADVGATRDSRGSSIPGAPPTPPPSYAFCSTSTFTEVWLSFVRSGLWCAAPIQALLPPLLDSRF